MATEPVSNYIVLEQAAHARDQDTWHMLMEEALAGLNCQVIQSTSDEAPGLLAYVEHHLGAHHSPDLFHVQHELVKAVSGALATKQRAAGKAATEAQATLAQMQERLQNPSDALEKRGPGRPPKATASLEQVAQQAEAASRESQRLSGQREQVARSIRAIGHAYHFVDLERGVRRNSKLIAGDIQAQIDTIRAIAQQEHLSETCLDRIEKAERVVPKMQATIAFVSGYVRQQVSHMALAPPVSYAMHASLIPSFLSRAGGPHAHGERRRAASCAGRSPAHPTVCARWRVRRVEPDRANPAQTTGQNAGRGVPAFQLQCGRAKRVSLVEEPSTARARAPQKARMSDSSAQLLPHASRRDDRGRAVFRAETSVDVCRDLGVRRHPPCSSQSAATSSRLGSKGIGWPAR